MEDVTSTEDRTAYLVETYDLTENAALALQLAELGYSTSGIASKLGLTQGTVRKYKTQCEKRIGAYVWESLPKSRKYDTFPSDKSESEYAGDHIDYSPEFTEPSLPRAKGKKTSELEWTKKNSA